MQKTEFIKAVVAAVEKEKGDNGSSITQKQAKQVIEAAIKVITDTLKKREKVTLTGFGTFEVRHRQQREGVNPQTRERMVIPETWTPGFSASSTLKEAVKEPTSN
jgi:DNA-binding protein HU-beta